MGKQMKKIKANKNRYLGDKKMQYQDISIAMTDAMLVFGANTNYMRQLPNLLDGLKPVERRVLYMMYKLGLRPSAGSLKSSKIVGDTMSTYHPHGDSSIYDVLVRMAQYWKMNLILTEPEGSFGNQYGDGASAMRYTESKLTKFAWDCYFSDFDISNVFTRPSYDDKSVEPEYLSAKYPVGLFNGCFGIGSGVKVDIPPHNPGEVMHVAIERIKDPEARVKPFHPDSPTGSDIIDNGTLDELFYNGKGKIAYRGIIEADFDDNALILYNPPPMVAMDGIIQAVSDLRQKGIIKGMINMHRNMIEGSAGLVYYFKKEIDILEVRKLIFKHTAMSKTLPVNFIALDNYSQVNYGFLRYIDEWIEIRRQYKETKITKQLIQAHEDIHTLEILLRIFDGKNAHKTIDYIKDNKTADVVPYLMDKFDITSLQAKKIVDMRLGAFSKDSMKRYKDNLPVLQKEKKRLEKLLNDSTKIDKEIIEELEEGIKKYGGARKSKIIKLNGEESVPNTKHKIVVTTGGFIKKLPISASSIGDLREGDIPLDIIEISNPEDLMVIDTTGMIHKLPVSKLVNNEMTDLGQQITDYVKLKGNICSILPKPNADTIREEHGVYMLMVTANGMVKKTNVYEFVNLKSSIVGMKVDKGDEVIGVKLTIGEDKDVLIYTESGAGIRYPSSDIKETGRTSKGIIAINKDEDDTVKGIDVINEKDKYILCLTDKGKAKRCDLKQFRTMKRGTKALRLITLDDGESIKLVQTIKGNESFKVFMKNDTLELNSKDVDELPRLAKGAKVLPVRRGDHIIDIKEVK